jgi:prepilin-type N-terminal cleavage/methylation domain-containing protein
MSKIPFRMRGFSLPEVVIVLVIGGVVLTATLGLLSVPGKNAEIDSKNQLLTKVTTEAFGNLEINSGFVSPVKSSEVPDEPYASCGWYPGLIPQNASDPKIVYCINQLLLQQPASNYDPGGLIKNGEVTPNRRDGFNLCYLLIDVEKSKRYPALNGVPYAISFRLINSIGAGKDHYSAFGHGEMLANFNCHGKMTELSGYVKGFNAIKDILAVHENNILHEEFSWGNVLLKWSYYEIDILINKLSILQNTLGITQNAYGTVKAVSQIIEGTKQVAPFHIAHVIPAIEMMAVTMPRSAQRLVDSVISLEKRLLKYQDKQGEIDAAEAKVVLAKSNKAKASATQDSYKKYIESIYNKGVWL